MTAIPRCRLPLCAAAALLILASAAPAAAQFRAPSPDGLASTETGGRYAGGRTPYYIEGKWIEVSYGRPIRRGRELWGDDATYGLWLNRGAPVWRAGADVSTYLMTEATLLVGGTEIAPGGYTMFIDLQPDDWTLIISNWQPQRRYDPNNDRELWGSYGYTPDKDLVRVSMELSELPWSIDQLTWSFLDMTDEGGRLAIMWDRMLAAVPFGIVPDPPAPETAADEPENGDVVPPYTVDPRAPPPPANAPVRQGAATPSPPR